MFEDEVSQKVLEELPKSVRLIWTDYRDEVPDDLYRRALKAGAEGRELIGEVLDYEMFPADDLYENAWQVLVECAANVGHTISDIPLPDLHRLVDEVFQRNTSDAWNELMDIAARDTVLLGVQLDDEFEYGADPAEIAKAFGVEDRLPGWAHTLSANGEGVAALLVAMSGDELLGYVRDAYVAASYGVEMFVDVRARDVGLINRIYGSGWFAPTDSPIGLLVTLPFQEFVRSVWVDNEPGARGTWTEIVGEARASGLGELRVRAVAP
jgi:hypothetical protein